MNHGSRSARKGTLSSIRALKTNATSVLIRITNLFGIQFTAYNLIIKPIINAFKIVPTPGFCLKGIHKNKTKILTMKVVAPIE